MTIGLQISPSVAAPGAAMLAAARLGASPSPASATVAAFEFAPSDLFILLRNRWLSWYRQRATRRALEQLDDWLLRDIGLERSQIASVSRACAMRDLG